jgi:multisubunit Na+/H+ antiporter MnhG subunit
MTFNMTLPMVGWMHYRGHSWERSGEMGAAMFVLAIALLAVLWLGLISAHVVLPLEMALIVPTMVVVMLHRADEYTQAHPSHRPATAPPVRAARVDG